ncbi:DUF4386 domain-containing protein [Paracnuella aquatica]|uniref:DUF4386 domain-containing protein n=1 Tax=Paracnuella aquatica TaxID=2268757 RepID=UPI00240D4B1C|nr:DUF4386 domain-containing protein [Paracnuella aquatica]
MFVLGVFAEFVVRNKLISWNDPVLTHTNIAQALPLFNAGIAAFVVIIVLDVLLAVAFYTLLRPAGKLRAGAMAVLRLLYVAIKGVAIVGLLLARDIYALPVEAATPNNEALAVQAMHFLKMHHYGFAVALVFFGLHLMLLGRILLQWGGAAKWIAWLVVVAGVGYFANSMITIFPTISSLLHNVIIAIFIVPMSCAEIALGLHLWFNRNQLARSFNTNPSGFLRQPSSNPA